jgi:hypothetical protein
VEFGSADFITRNASSGSTAEDARETSISSGISRNLSEREKRRFTRVRATPQLARAYSGAFSFLFSHV